MLCTFFQKNTSVDCVSFVLSCVIFINLSVKTTYRGLERRGVAYFQIPQQQGCVLYSCLS